MFLRDINETRDISSTCDYESLNGTPSTATLLKNLDDTGQYVWVAVWITVAITTLLFFDEFVFAMRRSSNHHLKRKIMWIRGLFVVFSWLSVLAIGIPRASLLADFAGSIYLSCAILQFYNLVTEYFGNEDNMVDKLSMINSGVPVASPPLCCCLRCVPKPAMTRPNLRRIRALIIQNAVVRPVVSFILLVVWADGGYTAGEARYVLVSTLLRVASGLSMMLAMYGLIILYRLGEEGLPLGHYLRAKLFDLQLVMILTSAQGGVLSAMVTAGYITCLGILDAYTVAAELYHLLLLGEMFLLACLTRVCHGVHHVLVSSPPDDSPLSSDLVPKDVTKRYIFV